MPQMAPMWWMSLYLYFTLTTMLMITFIYFNVNYKSSPPSFKTTNKLMMNMKW